jgi:hypothetical protein
VAAVTYIYHEITVLHVVQAVFLELAFGWRMKRSEKDARNSGVVVTTALSEVG